MTLLEDRRYRLGVDVGGTFTDVVLTGPDGRMSVRKVSSTPGRYDEGIIRGIGEALEEAGVTAADVVEVCHSTTAATNAVLERKGARVGLITTKGFRDVLEVRRLRTPTLYDLFYEPPDPLAPRYLRLEVDERMDASGQVLTSLDKDEVRRENWCSFLLKGLSRWRCVSSTHIGIQCTKGPSGSWLASGIS